MLFSPTDFTHMRQALAQAHQALFITSPNPRVGCVITSADGELLGQGHTQAAGQAHAIMALRDAQSRGLDVTGATAYVTLEPCAHQGRTGPCCDALIQSGIARVFASVQDPNPQVAGQGLARLRAAGIEVHTGLLEDEARELNIGFFKRMQHGTPWLRLKTAQSLDGQTALNNGASQWITSQAARDDGHHWRARACAVLSGIGTVLQDDPLLNVRAVDTPRQPDLLLVDSRLQTPLNAKLWQVKRRVVVFHALRDAEREAALTAQGATLVCLSGAGDKVDLHAMVQHLGQLNYNEVHVEAGHKLNGSLLNAGLIDELLVYLAPLLTGPGQSMAALPALTNLAQAQTWQFHETRQIGADLRLLLRRTR
ncbi:MAG: bifunctional diaminohydroxyphosphoribosylaminopyrimidine deaminase/5-amino-6-(5-phosphoribosylamino)uracil reductase RibD [Betaproteobacteria bacterium]